MRRVLIAVLLAGALLLAGRPGEYLPPGSLARAEGLTDLPELARSIIPEDFVFNSEFTALLNEEDDDPADLADGEMRDMAVTTRWWAFSHSGSVDEAFGALSIPDDANEVEPMSVPMTEVLTSYRDNLGDDALTARWGQGWLQQAEELEADWEDIEQRLAAAMLWSAGDMLNPEEDPTETVSVTAMLGGRNVSADSAGIVLESEHGPFVAGLLPDDDGEMLVGRLLPGRYELFVIYEADGRQAFSMETTTIDVMRGAGANANVALETWDFPMRMPWSMDDLSEAEPVTGVDAGAEVSFLSIYVVSPYLNPAELELVEGTHLLVSCAVHGEYEF